mgnify:CR=1 FL=1
MERVRRAASLIVSSASNTVFLAFFRNMAREYRILVLQFVLLVNPGTSHHMAHASFVVLTHGALALIIVLDTIVVRPISLSLGHTEVRFSVRVLFPGSLAWNLWHLVQQAIVIDSVLRTALVCRNATQNQSHAFRVSIHRHTSLFSDSLSVLYLFATRLRCRFSCSKSSTCFCSCLVTSLRLS